MCSLFGLIDFKECLSTHTKNKILNTLARECQVRMQPASPTMSMTVCASISVPFPLEK